MSFDLMSLELSAVHKRLAELEIKQAAMQAILERTPLNDEMKAAVELALRGEEWFQTMVEEFAKEQLDEMETALDGVKAGLRDLDHKVDELKQEHNDLSSKVHDLESTVEDLESTVEDLESTVEDLESTVKDLEGDDK